MAENVIVIVPYSGSWKEEFRRIAKPMRETLGTLALRIDHIGSTAVDGLAAKDRIDIQITIASSDDFAKAKDALESMGYTQSPRIFSDHVPPDGPFEAEQWEKRIFSQPQQQRPTNTHVRIINRANQIYPILFRDFLRTSKKHADCYALLKQQLAKHHANDVEAYYDIKDPICDLISIAAKEWAANTRWQQGSSDA